MIKSSSQKIYRLIVSVFVIFVIILVLKKIIFSYAGDGSLMVNYNFFPGANSCNLTFEKISLDKKMISQKYKFRNVPCSYLEANLYVDFSCLGSDKKSVQNIEMNNFHEEALNKAEIQLSIYDEYDEYVYIGGSRFHVSNNFPGDWIPLHYPEIWRYENVTLSSFKPRNGRDYVFEFSIKSEQDDNLGGICIQPFLTSGTPFNL